MRLFNTVDNSLQLLEVGQGESELAKPFISKEHFRLMSGVIDECTDDIWNQLELSYVNHYIIFNSKNESVGIIRLVKEMNDVLSVHGAGWAQNDFIYSKAWIYFIAQLAASNPKIRSYCRNENFKAIHALTRSGFRLTSSLRIKGMSPKLFFEFNLDSCGTNKLVISETQETLILTGRYKRGEVHFNKINVERCLRYENLGVEHFDQFGKRLLSIPQPILTVHSLRKSSFSCLTTQWPNDTSTYFINGIVIGKEWEIAFLFYQISLQMRTYDRIEVESPTTWLTIYLNSLFYYCGIKELSNHVWQL